MKHLHFTILLAMLMSMMGTKVSAYDFAVENGDGVMIYYYYIDDNQVGVTYKTLGGPNYDAEGYEGVTTLNIPETVTYNNQEYSVTSIGRSAFDGCSGLTSVAIPNSVTSIGSWTFCDCSGLTSVTIPNSLTSIGDHAFVHCSGLTSVTIPNSVTSIGEYAFTGCSGLTSIIVESGNLIYDSRDNCNAIIHKATKELIVGCNNTIIPNSVTSIGVEAFYECSGLTSVIIPNSVMSIGSSAFRDCNGLTSVTIGNSVTSIEEYAFSGCYGLTSVSIPNSVTSIGSSVFDAPVVVTITATTPITLTSNDSFGEYSLIRVPDAAVEAYQEANLWSDFANRIVGVSTQIDYDVTVSVDNNRSTLSETIGELNLQHVMSLKVTGDINSYDFMVMRNKMDNLHILDLTDANIVANNYEYVSGCHTEDNVFPANSFSGLGKIFTMKLPKSIKSIGYNAFYNCSNLRDVEFQSGLERIEPSAFLKCSNLREVEFHTGLRSIGNSAFCGCKNLQVISLNEGLETIGNYAFGTTSPSIYGSCKVVELIIPNGVTSIGNYAFSANEYLKQVYLPNSLKTMGEGAFYRCKNLESISLPTSLESIPSSAFDGCSELKRIDIPSTIMSIGNKAFSGCSALSDVYTYIVEPTPIDMETFSTYTTATLHVPSTSYYNYWYDTEWSQFRKLEEFIAVYEYFYINNDFTIGDEQGVISGDVFSDDPDADLNPGSGLIVETSENNPQNLNEVHIKMKGADNASIIAASNLSANKVYFDIEIQAGRWYFLAFPFNVKKTNITAPGTYVFRTYDPEERANGKTGWQDWIGDLLNKGQGYIFHCSKNGTLSLCVEKADMDWDAENRPRALASAPAEDQQDASWNFIGNPQTSYYDIDETGYTQPITVWNGESYEAVRAGDDTYALSPCEAFFVQKPSNTDEMEFPAEGRYTQTQWEQVQSTKAAARRLGGVKTDRLLVNLVLSDGQTEDKTRVVFNEKKSKGYEMECDAPKFMSSNVPQLYSLDQQQSRYAINERPMGEVRLGYTAPAKGELTIKAMRMDQPMMLRDTKLQITHDLSVGDYTFSTEGGTFNSRFLLVVDNSATNVGKLREQTGVSIMAEEGGISFLGISEEPVDVYSVGGVLMAAHVGNGFLSLPKAAYLVKVGTATAKVIVR